MYKIPMWFATLMIIIGLVMTIGVLLSGEAEGATPVTAILAILIFAIPLYMIFKGKV